MSETDVLTGGGTIEEAASSRRARAPLPERCYACAAPVRGPYCYACGQKNDDCRRSVWTLLSETVRDTTSLDGRFMRTLRAVSWRPGRYIRRYGDGVRSPYSPPIRFFLVVSFLFFTTLWITDRQIVVVQPDVELTEEGELDIRDWAGGFFEKPRDVAYTAEERAAMLQAMREGDAPALTEEALRAQAEADIRQAEALAEARIAGLSDPADIAEAEEALRDEVALIRYELSEALAELAMKRAAAEEGLAEGAAELREQFGEDAPGAEALDRAAARIEEGEGAAPDSLTVNGRQVDRERLATALVRLAENPRLFNAALGDWIPRIMILMVPLLAILGAVFVRGRDALLYDHLVLSLNTHAVAFGLMTLGLWTAALPFGGLFAWATVIGVPFYWYRAVRGAFGRSRRKSLAATLFAFGLYAVVFLTALTAAAVNAFTEVL
jgi:hypothetical protein